jgi:hypothetical protein
MDEGGEEERRKGAAGREKIEDIGRRNEEREKGNTTRRWKGM